MPRYRVPALLILAIAFLVADADPSLSRNPYKNAFFSVYPAADGTALTDVPSNANHCGVCHFDFDGSGTRNPYGLDVQVGLNSGQYASTVDVILAIQNLDSDNDGFSNLVEITDTVNFPNTPTFPGLTAGNVANTVNVNQADLLDFLTPGGGSDTDPPAVTVLTPDGGEIAAATGTILVTWTADDPSGVTRIDLYLSGDDGGDWEPMARDLPNDGSYLMFVPNYPGDLARIKVAARDGAGNWGEDASNGPFSITPLPGGTAPTTLRDFKMPGTQPLESGVLEDPGANCVTCHGDYNHAVEPWHNWRGSMMAHAMRDPLMLALLAVAEQDAPASGDLCLRCHSPGGWQEGHSFDTTGGMMTAKDRQSVQCDYCHRLVDRVYVPGVSPAADEAILATVDPLPPAYANGMFVTDPDPIRRGPYADAQADHQFLHSPFHLEAGLCGICHDVSNPAFVRGASPEEYVVDDLDAQHPDGDLRNMFPVERTFSEWSVSEYASTGVYAPQFAGNKPGGIVSTCQDCHMKDVAGKGAAGGPVRTDLALHDLTGGNHFTPDVLGDFFPGEVDAAQLQDGKLRAEYMLSLAANLELIETPVGGAPGLTVRVINETGHKLPSGYPEGRRMWLSLQVYDEDSNLVHESGAYDAATGVLAESEDLRLYHIKPGISTRLASLLGLEAGPSFHFVLNDTIYLDNRIPPRGFSHDAFVAIQSAPVGVTYPEGQFWDDVLYELPFGAKRVDVTLYYQSTSKEFIEFLRDENETNDLGQQLHDAWVAQGRAAPVAMAQASITLTLTDVPEDEAPAYANALAQNVPNPFNPDTRIEYSLARAGRARLLVLDARGRLVRTLVDETLPAGPHAVTWHGRDDAGRRMPSGLYLYRLETPTTTHTRKMLMIK